MVLVISLKIVSHIGQEVFSILCCSETKIPDSATNVSGVLFDHCQWPPYNDGVVSVKTNVGGVWNMTQSKYPGHSLRYVLYAALFALILIGIILHSYSLLAVLAVVGIVLAVVGDRLENSNSEPYKENNRLHHL